MVFLGDAIQVTESVTLYWVQPLQCVLLDLYAELYI